MSAADRLTEQELLLLVNEYIGSTGDGYLPGFSYTQHEEFYAQYCDLDVNVAEKRKTCGTTRKTFLAILREAEPLEQARIVEGVFRYFETRDQADLPSTRATARDRLQAAIGRIRKAPVVALPDLRVAGEAVRQAVRDASTLLVQHGPTNAFDRVHTAFHGYLKALCAVAKVQVDDPKAGPAAFWSLLKKSPVISALTSSHPEKQNLEKVLNALGSIVSATEALRNRTSLAHPNDELIPADEASLAIDAMSGMVNYLTRKIPK